MERKEIWIPTEDIRRLWNIRNVDIARLIFTCLVLTQEDIKNGGTGEIVIDEDELLRLSDCKVVYCYLMRYEAITISSLENNKYKIKYINAYKSEDKEDFKIDLKYIGLYYMYFYGWFDAHETWKRCEVCGIPYAARGNHQKRCEEHIKRRPREKCLHCDKCGTLIILEDGQRKRKYCPECKKEHDREYFRNKRREYRSA